MDPEEEYENAREELALLNRKIDQFWEQPGADEMEDTYGELLDERDSLKEYVAELERSRRFY